MDVNRSDALTVACIGIAAYVVSNVLHEGAGHGGACIISGGKALVISTVHMECSAETRLVMAGGTLMNFIAARVFFLIARARTVAHARLRFFLWLAMSINLFTATGYFLFSGIGGFGDWAAFIGGFGNQWLSRAMLAIIGAVTYMFAARVSLLEMRPLIGSEPKERIGRAIPLMRIPYFTGGTLACIAGSLNPAGWYLIALSAAASTFGGTSAFVWMHRWLKDSKSIPLGSQLDPPTIERSWGWIVAGVCVAAISIFVIGPGIRFSRG